MPFGGAPPFIIERGPFTANDEDRGGGGLLPGDTAGAAGVLRLMVFL
jgi:hypothetical protein